MTTANEWKIIAKTSSLVYLFQLGFAFSIPVALRPPDYGFYATTILTLLNAAIIFPIIYVLPRMSFYLWPIYVSASTAIITFFSFSTPYTLDATPASPVAALYPLLLIAPSIVFVLASLIKPKAVIGLYVTYWLGFVGVPLLALTYIKFLG